MSAVLSRPKPAAQNAAAALQLDFRAKPSPRERRVAWLALIVAIGLVLGLLPAQQRLAARLEQAQSHVQTLQTKMQAAPSSTRVGKSANAAVNAEGLRRIQRANAVIDQLTLPWERLFHTVEAADASGLGLLSLTPNPKDQSLRLSGEAKNMAEVLAYVDRLAAQPMLHQVHLNAYETVLRDGVNIIQFSLEAQWDRAAGDDARPTSKGSLKDTTVVPLTPLKAAPK